MSMRARMRLMLGENYEDACEDDDYDVVVGNDDDDNHAVDDDVPFSGVNKPTWPICPLT